MQIVDIPVPVESLQGLRPGQGSTASSSFSHSPTGVLDDADEEFDGFPGLKKCEGRLSLQVGTGRALEPIHAGCLWRGEGARGAVVVGGSPRT